MINLDVCDTSSDEGVVASNNLTRLEFGHVIPFAPMSNGVTVTVNKVPAEAEQSPTGMIKKLAI